jgi:hypothetical protein
MSFIEQISAVLMADIAYGGIIKERSHYVNVAVILGDRNE